MFSIHFNLNTDLWQLINFLLEAGAAQAVGRQGLVTAVSDRQTQETIAELPRDNNGISRR